MTIYYLAVDIGASSGRHILGYKQDGKMIIEEIYRFENFITKKDTFLCWDLGHLFHEIQNGMKQCRALNKIPISMAIDTWGVDFVLFDKENQLLGNSVSYRDTRTNGMDEQVSQVISQQELYQRTGIQKQIFNTIYQLIAIKKSNPEFLEQAKRFLMIPEYFNYLLTGKIKNEYTNSTTTQLVNAETKTWDTDILSRLGIPAQIFGQIYPPKTLVGTLRDNICSEVGFDCEVMLAASHDTASAVLSASTDNGIYLSSGTWSLMGVERSVPDCSEQSHKLNFTNEGGFEGHFRYLKNIMGLWMIQSVRRELQQKFSFDELCAFARKVEHFDSRIDVNDSSFLSPANMTEAVKDYCKKTDQKIPQTIGELFSCIYHSLAQSYANTIREIEQLTGNTYDSVHIVGGGSKDVYLNALTAQYSEKRILAGPSEATAIGNLLCQMLKYESFSSLAEARFAVARSFPIKEFNNEQRRI